MKIFTKWLPVPESNDTRDVEVGQLWEVRWKSRRGAYSSDLRPEVEVFLSREDADIFATSLRNAFRLLRHTSGDRVEVLKA